MNTSYWVACNLAAEMLSGEWNESALIRRTEKFLGSETKKFQRALVRDVLHQTTTPYPPSPDELFVCLTSNPAFFRATKPLRKRKQPLKAVLKPAKFAPAARFNGLNIPEIDTVHTLAEWLGVTTRELDWFADQKKMQCRSLAPPLQHYRYSFVSKAKGPPRLIEAPKPRMKALQRKILREILNAVPTHDCAHGFVAGRSCVTSAAAHASEAIVMSLDLTDFFLMTRLSRVHRLFRSLGYPVEIARYLTALTSNMTPDLYFSRLPKPQRHDVETRQLYRAPHLPQGAPTSPALANLVAWTLDVRLHGFAKSYGANYTRYADDLAFSGDHAVAKRGGEFLARLKAIVLEEGFSINERKTRIMQSSACQRLTGIVVNDHVNISRAAYDQLKATLHNCITTTPAEQNREGIAHYRSHLDGRVTWVEHLNPQRGMRLRRMFNEINWKTEAG